MNDQLEPSPREVRGMMRDRCAHNALSTLSLGLLMLVCGCQTLPSKWEIPWEKDPGPMLPDRILAVWSDTVLHQPGQPGVRGFGGRIFFYNEEHTEPVKVDGGLMIYVFDAETYDPSQPQPLRRFAYTADQFAELYSKASLGNSYSVWLPWDEVGGEARSLSLVVKFEGREGGTVISDPVVKLLPGLPKETVARRRAMLGDGDVRLVGYEQDAATSSTSPRRSYEISPQNNGLASRRVETIDLPPSFSRHLQREVSGVGRAVDRANPTQTPATALPYAEPVPGSRDARSQRNEGSDLLDRSGARSTNNQSFDMDQPQSRAPSQVTLEAAPVAFESTALPGMQSRVGSNRVDWTGAEPDNRELYRERPRAGSWGSSPYRTYPTSDPNRPITPGRTIRTQPFPGGWVSDLPQTPRAQ